MTGPGRPTVLRASDEGEALWIMGGLYTYRAIPSETGYLAVEVEGSRGLAAPLHFHDGDDEGFYVTQGTVRILVGDRAIDASAGAFVLAPKGVQHTFVFASDDAKLLLLLTPGTDHERLFRAIGQRAERREIPAPASTPPDFARLAAIASKNGTTIVGPPPAGRG